MDLLELFQRLSVALAIGLLIGVERGWQGRSEPEGERAAGMRTFALAGLLGGIWAVVAGALGDGGAIALGLAFAVFTAVIAAYRLRELEHDKSFGATTVVAAMLTFALGAFAVLGNMVAAAATGVAATLLLALKAVLHRWLQRLSWDELRAGLVLLAMTFIALPILPDRAYGPFDALNPYEIWLMTVLIAAVSFAGYVAIKIAGERQGILLSGIAGGLVSSTATTLSFARLARANPKRGRLLTAGAALASAAMMLRIIFVAGLFNFALLRWLVVPLCLAALVLGAAAFLFLRQGPAAMAETPPLELRNPFEFGTVLQFGLLLAVILLLAKVLAVAAGAAGAYALAAASGLADVDAITLSMARLAPTDLPLESAATAILIAALANTVSKTALYWTAGGPVAGRILAAGAGLAVAAGGAGFVLSAWWDPAAAMGLLGARG